MKPNIVVTVVHQNKNKTPPTSEKKSHNKTKPTNIDRTVYVSYDNGDDTVANHNDTMMVKEGTATSVFIYLFICPVLYSFPTCFSPSIRPPQSVSRKER